MNPMVISNDIVNKWNRYVLNISKNINKRRLQKPIKNDHCSSLKLFSIMTIFSADICMHLLHIIVTNSLNTTPNKLSSHHTYIP